MRHRRTWRAAAAGWLAEYFNGPTPDEQARGLVLTASGFTGVSRLTIQDGIAHVRLAGECAATGAAYNAAEPLMRTLLQFPDIRTVKLYDPNGHTGDPAGESNSIPACLEP